MKNHVERLAFNRLVVSYRPCVLNALRGVWSGAADAWLMIFNSHTAANDDAPLRQFQVFAQAPFDWSWHDDPLVFDTACYVAFSTTKDTLTLAAGAGNNGDIFADGTGFEPTLAPLVIGGDLVTLTRYLDLWAENDGRQRLVRLEISSIAASDCFAMVFAHAAPDNGEKPIFSIRVNAGTTKRVEFGDEGRLITRLNSAGVLEKACTIVMSNPVDGTSASDAGAAASLNASLLDAFCIRGTYRPA